MASRGQAYLPHIDGLRCLAVVAVLLFHFGVPRLGGGYVGVDVFFVISGYLITKGIVEELSRTGTFSFAHFYSRRIRRIIPALVATLLATMLVAIASLTPVDLIAYGKSLFASAISASNLLFWSESGYFDAVSKTKPLLHTWSLSVEEQFYLLWPAIIYLVFRLWGRRAMVWGIAVAGIASFAANHAVVAAHHVDYKAGLFFLPQFRVFEFAIGAAGCFTVKKLPPSRLVHELMMLVGLLLVCYSIVHLREGRVFPYTNALAPCVGALMVIAAERSITIGSLLTNRVAVWIGTISYSLYLTHWPVVVFTEQYAPMAGWGVKFVVMASLSLVTALALYYGVESRYRYAGSAEGRGVLVYRLVAASIITAALGGAVFASYGMIWRYNYFTPGTFPTGSLMAASARFGSGPAQTGGQPAFHPLTVQDIEAGRSRRFDDLQQACNLLVLRNHKRCFMERPVQVLFFGNSHEPDAFNAFKHLYGGDPRVNLINFGTANHCEIVVGSNTIASPTQELACDQRFAALNDNEFLKQVDVLVYNTHSGFEGYSQPLWRVLEFVKQKNPAIKIIAIGSYMQTKMDCATLYNKYGTYDACKRKELVEGFHPDEREISPIPQVKTLEYTYISKAELFCKNEELATCTMYANGEPAFYDQHHLSMGFARYLGDRIAETHLADLVAAGLPVPIMYARSSGMSSRTQTEAPRSQAAPQP